ncbi:hypothetical protein Aoki45_02910 [Algoriphagus sp. oki45]|uniref:hypothetical protein n=1 Tax=Algoriphagus sp. oki45 TaxID=3067294 RepID=UPI0027E8828F|nr:hypothetical protein Aoki45_02910 [Algoriphagus sp. oki45]
MKTLFTFALAGTLTLGSLASFASDDLRADSDVKANFKKVNVLLKEGVGEAKIAIYDESGKKLHQKKVKVQDQDVVIPYNLSELPCGEFTVKIESDSEEVEYKVNTFERPTFVEASPLTAYSKMIDRNTIQLTVIGIVEEGVKVRIREEGSNQIVYSEDLAVKDAFKKDYSLKGMEAQDIYFEVIDSRGQMKSLHFE